MRVGLYLLNQKGYTVLNDLISAFSYEIISFVVSDFDKGLENDYFEEIKLTCFNNNIKFYNRVDISDYSGLYSDYIFAVGWRWLIKSSSNLIVLHDSILPKYRGFSPLVNMLINGEKRIGVTALKASYEYDKGDIIFKKSIEISYPIKIQSAIDLILPLYSDIILKICSQLYEKKELFLIKQLESEASYSLWRDEIDYLIDWSYDSNDIKRFCDSVGFPYKGASAYINSKKVRILDVEVYCDVIIENRKNNIGKIIFMNAGFPIIVCSSGLLKIKQIISDDDSQSLIGKLNFRTRFTSVKLDN